MKKIVILATAAVLAAASASVADPFDESLAELRATAGSKLNVLAADGQPVIRHLDGRLTASPTADIAAAGVQFLSRHAQALGLSRGTAVELERSVPLLTGTVLRYRQRIAGVPVLGGEVALRFDADGVLRMVNSGLAPFTRIADAVPTIGSADTLAQVLELPNVVAALDPDAVWIGLVYFPAGDEARLAWQVETGAVPALLANWVTWVDAHTGEVLAQRNRIDFDRLANVFLENPVTTPGPTEVTLTDLPAWTADPYYLTSELILARNCIDQHTLTPLTYGGTTFNVHTCSEVQVAAGDTAQDFLYTDNTDTAPEDLFAEPAMFYHATRVYDFFQALGFTRLRQVPLACSVNFRIPVDMAGGIDFANMTNPNGTLYPFDNAFFLPAGGMAGIFPRDTDSIVFGQGTHGDFSYDGDIVYHEFTHAVIDSTIGLQAASFDDQGLDIGPGALNEGYADVFAMFMTGDPGMGDYGGVDLTPSGLIRDLENDNRCPEDMIGEVHEDSLPWGSAAWEIYALYGDPVVQPYYDAMMSLVYGSDFAVAVSSTLAELNAALGATVEAAARAEFERRNIVNCLRVIESGTAAFPQLAGEGTGTVTLRPYVPGYAMFHITVPAGQTQIWAVFGATGGGFMGGTIVPHVLFRNGPDRLSFRLSGTTVIGNEDWAVDATEVRSNTYEAVYCEASGTIPAGDYWVMIANSGAGAMALTDIELGFNNSTPMSLCRGTDLDAGDGAPDVVEDVPEDVPAEAEADATPPTGCNPTDCTNNCRWAGQAGGSCVGEGDAAQCVCSSDSGCGCRAVGGHGGAALLGLLFVGLAVVIRRRRRT
jgi:MYXO-CTERM domain-containing protein